MNFSCIVKDWALTEEVLRRRDHTPLNQSNEEISPTCISILSIRRWAPKLESILRGETCQIYWPNFIEKYFVDGKAGVRPAIYGGPHWVEVVWKRISHSLR